MPELGVTRATDLRRRPLRLAVVLESTTAVPSWIGRTVVEIDESSAFDLVAVVLAQPDAPPRTRMGSSAELAYRLYTWADARIFGPRPSTRRPMDLQARVGDRLVVGDTVEGIDVAVCLASGDVRRWRSLAPRFGTWVAVPGDSMRSAPCFWAVYERRPEIQVELVVLHDGEMLLVDQ